MFALVALAGLWWLASRASAQPGEFMTDTTQPRGIRNNNPLNIKWNALNNWQGQTGADAQGFAQFDTPVNGIRAAARLLKNYRASGHDTPREIITRWTSGDSAEIQQSYIDHVSARLGIWPDEQVHPDSYELLVITMIQHENGVQPYSLDTIAQGVAAGWQG